MHSCINYVIKTESKNQFSCGPFTATKNPLFWPSKTPILFPRDFTEQLNLQRSWSEWLSPKWTVSPRMALLTSWTPLAHTPRTKAGLKQRDWSSENFQNHPPIFALLLCTHLLLFQWPDGWVYWAFGLTPSPSPLPCHTSLSWSFFSCLLLDQHLFESYSLIMGFLSGSVIKILPTIQETQVQFLGQENPLEEGVTAPSSILAGKNPMDRGAWQATVMGLQRVRYNWSGRAAAVFTHCFF